MALYPSSCSRIHSLVRQPHRTWLQPSSRVLSPLLHSSQDCHRQLVLPTRSIQMVALPIWGLDGLSECKNGSCKQTRSTGRVILNGIALPVSCFVLPHQLAFLSCLASLLDKQSPCRIVEYPCFIFIFLFPRRVYIVDVPRWPPCRIEDVRMHPGFQSVPSMPMKWGLHPSPS